MKDYILDLVLKQKGHNARLNLLREYLQAYILRVMHDAGVFRSVAFVGGTALRFLYGLPRFSEDLDLSAVRGEGPPFSGLLKKIKGELTLAGYDVAVNYDDETTVRSAFVKFSGLLREAGLTGHKDQKLSIKIELDSNPPEGAGVEVRVVNKYFPIAFQTYDVPSLFAGKAHCVFARKYIKGRDFFDIGWYLSKWPGLSPNIILLNNALKQTGWKGGPIAAGGWRDIIYEKTARTDWEKVRRDVENFLENPSDRDVFTKENILGLIRGGGDTVSG